jgi:caffeoyl-CoA O-methyltransferase
VRHLRLAEAVVEEGFMKLGAGLRVVPIVSALALVPVPVPAEEASIQALRDERVEAFLQARESSWRDMNIPRRDGQFLHDMIVEKAYTRALEIGTSTGHSSIWIAWALSKTGGRLITLEIDESRHREALENFEKAGLSDFIDARLVDAHEAVKTIEGPFDFVFSDADKGWYKQYFIDLAPKMAPGGCYTSHNIGMRGMGDYVDYQKSRPGFVTTIEDDLTSGIGVTCRIE